MLVITALTGSVVQLQAQTRWEPSSYAGERGKSVMGCSDTMTEDSWLCLAVRCDAAGQLGLYADITNIDLNGRFRLKVDGQVFPVEGSSAPKPSAYNTRITGPVGDIVAAMMKGSRVIIDYPEIKLNPGYDIIPLRGSSKAIGGIVSACMAGASPVAAASDAVADSGITELKGLSSQEDCAFAKSRGIVGKLEMTANGSMLEGFWFKDHKYGKSYINLDDLPSGARREKVRAGLFHLLRPGNELELGVYGCGASGAIEKLASVKLIKPIAAKKVAEKQDVKQEPAKVEAQNSNAPADIDASAVDPVSLNVRGVALSRGGDKAGGFRLIKQAADQGDIRALANLGVMTRDGVGTFKDVDAGNAALAKAASAGDPFAALALGASYQEGIGVAKSPEKAFELWEPVYESIASPEVKFRAAQGMALHPASLSAEDARLASFMLCGEAAAQGHRPALFYCNDYSQNPNDVKRIVANIDRAVARKAWSDGMMLERVYVGEFFSDNDQKVRALVRAMAGHVAKTLSIDLVAHVQKIGFDMSID